ncbi:MAG: hypothetical protein KGZ53_09660 [Peptococcaceae bacterium]|nr:hypothetical protein [Peptococcaceae bacterium]
MLKFMTSPKIMHVRRSLFIGFILAALAYAYVPGPVNYLVREYYVITAGDSATELFLAVLQPNTGPYQSISNGAATLSTAWQGQDIEGSEFVNVIAHSTTLQPRQTTEVSFSYRASIKRGTRSVAARIYTATTPTRKEH